MIHIHDDRFLTDRELQAVAYAAAEWPVRRPDVWLLDVRTGKPISLWEAEMVGPLGYGLVYRHSPEMAGALEGGRAPEMMLHALSFLFGGRYLEFLRAEPDQVSRTVVRILNERQDRRHVAKERRTYG